MNRVNRIIDNNSITSDCNIQITQVRKLDADEKNVIATFENKELEVNHLKMQINIDLKPGKKITILEEQIGNGTTAYAENSDINIPRYGIIDNKINAYNALSQTINNTAESELKETIAIINEQNAVLKNKLIQAMRELSNIFVEKKFLKRQLDAQHKDIENLIGKEKRNSVMLKYGIVSYLIYLIFGLGVFFSSGTMFLMWRIRNIAFFNPGSLFLFTIMGFGWSITAIAGLYSLKNRGKKNE